MGKNNLNEPAKSVETTGLETLQLEKLELEALIEKQSGSLNDLENENQALKSLVAEKEQTISAMTTRIEDLLSNTGKSDTKKFSWTEKFSKEKKSEE